LRSVAALLSSQVERRGNKGQQATKYSTATTTSERWLLVGNIARDRGCEAVDVLELEYVRCRNSATLTQHQSTSYDPALSPPIDDVFLHGGVLLLLLSFVSLL
jgi:hypothetical protein